MANREQRSNRQTKKPKKVKSKDAAASPASVWAIVNKAHTGADGKK